MWSNCATTGADADLVKARRDVPDHHGPAGDAVVGLAEVLLEVPCRSLAQKKGEQVIPTTRQSTQDIYVRDSQLKDC